MRIFTLTLLTLVLAGTATAQPKFSLRATSPIATKVNAMKKAKQMKANRNQIAAMSSTEAIMRPAQEEEWIYEEGEFYKEADYFYTYDQRGNKLTEDYDDGISINKTEYTYNENDKVTSEITSDSEEGEPFVYNTKRLSTYDSKLTNFIIESDNYSWNEDSWERYNDGHIYKKEITRDEKGNITNLSVLTYMNEYIETYKTTITYNENGLAETWKLEELNYNGVGYSMEEVYTLTEMEWYTTDGQIVVLNDLDDFFVGNNRLKKATVYSEGELTGYIEAEYKENGDYKYKYTYVTEPIAEETYTHSVTDANGSYVETCVAYEDIDEDQTLTEVDLAFEDELIVTCDQHGKVIEEQYFMDEEMEFAAKYEYTYSDEYGDYPTEQIFTEYDFDTETYVPFLKIVAKNFNDVTAIEDVNIDAANQPEEIYNLQGIRIDATSDQLPTGLYIIKQGNKTSKIIKR